MLAITNILLFFLVFTYTDASPTDIGGSGAAISRDQIPTYTYFDPGGKAPESTVSPLAPRFLINIALHNHWQLTVESFEIFLAGAPTPIILTDFYAAMEAHALTFQNQFTTAPQTSFVVDNLRLDFYCAIGHIPWPFIRNFARLMRMYSERGWTGLFKARATHLSGVNIFIRLSLGQIAAAAK